MADSHGQPQTIISALEMFRKMGCRPVYHLGDVCDSTHPETVEACLKPLRDDCVIMIKGNNDHAIVANHFGRKRSPVSTENLLFLKNLPLVKYHLNALFVHSRPFIHEMGLSSMIGDLGEGETRRFFKEFPSHILFRGHSHSPDLVWPKGRHFESRSPVAGEKFDLTDKIPCVVTCGALSRGLCMVWRPTVNVIECHSL